MKVKTEIIDLSYEDSAEASRSSEVDSDSEAMLVAQRIKEEFEGDARNQEGLRNGHSQHGLTRVDNVNSMHEHEYKGQRHYEPFSRHESASRTSTPHTIHSSTHPSTNGVEQKPPLIFDHFICMRIGLNSHNNVQRLMALLAAHDFVDITVLPSPAPVAPVIQAPPPLAAAFHPAMQLPFLSALARASSFPTTSKPSEIVTIESPSVSTVTATATVTAASTPLSVKQLQHPSNKKNHTRRVNKIQHVGGDVYTLPATVKCRKCSEIVQKGMPASIVLNHVQKAHLKIAAFQCRICKHYRTTQDRIQSHVTTVHKAKSNKFDETLAGPISSGDIRKMEQMITKCFPALKMELEITDKLVVKKFQAQE